MRSSAGTASDGGANAIIAVGRQGKNLLANSRIDIVEWKPSVCGGYRDRHE